jgi:hypothetical protein
MRGSVKSRLEQLEKRAGIGDDPLTVIIVRFAGAIDGKPDTKGTLTGLKVHGQRISRPMHESEQSFIERVKADHFKLMMPGEGVLVMQEIRGDDV